MSCKSITENCLIPKLLRPFSLPLPKRTGQHSLFYRTDYPLGEIHKFWQVSGEVGLEIFEIYLRQILGKKNLLIPIYLILWINRFFKIKFQPKYLLRPYRLKNVFSNWTKKVCQLIRLPRPLSHPRVLGIHLILDNDYDRSGKLHFFFRVTKVRLLYYSSTYIMTSINLKQIWYNANQFFLLFFNR